MLDVARYPYELVAVVPPIKVLGATGSALRAFALVGQPGRPGRQAWEDAPFGAIASNPRAMQRVLGMSVRQAFITFCLLGLASAPGVLAADPAAAPAPRALVFRHNPVRTPTAEVQELPLVPTGAYLEHPWLVAQSCVDTGQTISVQLGAGTTTVRVCTPTLTAQPDPSGVYSAQPRMEPGALKPLPDPFAEASLFHHAALTLAYFQGLGLAPPWLEKRPPLRLVANVKLPPEFFGKQAPLEGAELEPWGDALFIAHSRKDGGLLARMGTGDSDTIWFGQGPAAKLAYDGDTIAHEVSHAVLESLLPQGAWQLDEYGADAAPGAIDEGLADYFAAALSGDPFIGEYSALNAEAWQSRNIDTQSRCPEALVGRRHADSLVVSSALWAIRARLGRERGPRLDRAIIQALQSPRTEPGLSFEGLLSSTLRALAQDDPEAAEAARTELTRRGLLPACARILELTPGQSLSGPAGSFLSPGTKTLGVQGLAPGPLQFHLRVPKDTAAVRLRFRGAPSRPAAPGQETTSFQPRVLARRGEPLRWKYEATPQPNAQSAHEPEGNPIRTVRIETAGASELYLQIVNAGAQDGWYDELAVSFDPASGPPPATSHRTPRVEVLLWGCGGAAGAGLGWWLWRRRRRAR